MRTNRNIISYGILFAVLLTAVLSSCSLETDNEAGDLKGMWHLTSIETLATEGSDDGTTVEDVSQKRYFWSFQMKLLELDDKDGGHYGILYRFALDGSTLTLSSPYRYDRTNGDEPISDTSLLTTFGINELTPTYQVNVSGDKLTLSNNTTRLHFVKY